MLMTAGLVWPIHENIEADPFIRLSAPVLLEADLWNVKLEN